MVFQLGYARRGELAVPKEVHEQRKGVQVACRARPCFRVADVRDKRILSVFLFLAVRRVSAADGAGRKGGAVQVGAGGERRLARGLAERAPVVAPVGG